MGDFNLSKYLKNYKFSHVTKMSMYRNTIWFIKGYQEYTKSGYLKKSANFTPLSRDLTGKDVMITGGNSGIGLDAAKTLGKLGANIHIVCRSKERGEKAENEIKENSTGKTKLHILDLSDSKKIHEFGNEFINSKIELYCLVNNAGCMINQRETNDFGYEVITTIMKVYKNKKLEKFCNKYSRNVYSYSKIN